ncbi:MAG: response regulator [Candidatus Omnitrophota bacterium]|nr:response regulator [Candidatus Omnitrophota bacterium]
MAKIFIVDDETTFQDVVKPFLEIKGHKVLTAVSGEEALPVIYAEKPDLVLLDMHLKGKLNGIGILKYIKEKIPSAAVIMLTGMEDNVRQEALSLGADKFLTKPVTVKALNEAVNEVLNKAAPPKT